MRYSVIFQLFCLKKRHFLIERIMKLPIDLVFFCFILKYSIVQALVLAFCGIYRMIQKEFKALYFDTTTRTQILIGTVVISNAFEEYSVQCSALKLMVIHELKTPKIKKNFSLRFHKRVKYDKYLIECFESGSFCALIQHVTSLPALTQRRLHGAKFGPRSFYSAEKNH